MYKSCLPLPPEPLMRLPLGFGSASLPCAIARKPPYVAWLPSTSRLSNSASTELSFWENNKLASRSALNIVPPCDFNSLSPEKYHRLFWFFRLQMGLSSRRFARTVDPCHTRLWGSLEGRCSPAFGSSLLSDIARLPRTTTLIHASGAELPAEAGLTKAELAGSRAVFCYI